MPILDGSDDGDFYTEEDSFYDSKWPRWPVRNTNTVEDSEQKDQKDDVESEDSGS